MACCSKDLPTAHTMHLHLSRGHFRRLCLLLCPCKVMVPLKALISHKLACYIRGNYGYEGKSASFFLRVYHLEAQLLEDVCSHVMSAAEDESQKPAPSWQLVDKLSGSTSDMGWFYVCC